MSPRPCKELKLGNLTDSLWWNLLNRRLEQQYRNNVLVTSEIVQCNKRKEEK